MSDSKHEGYVKTNGLDLYYKILGNRGDPLLMIMGLSFSHLDWGEQFPSLLAKNYQVILLDNRDAGQSSEAKGLYSMADMADDAVDLLDALSIDKAHIFGVSMGGMIAQKLALKYPEKVDRLILGCTSCSGLTIQGVGQLLAGKSLLELLFTPKYLADHRSDLNVFLKRTQPYHSKGFGLVRQLGAIATHNTCTKNHQISAPTLVITGDEDTVIPAENSNTLAKSIPKAQLEIINGAAHAFCYSHAETSANLAHRFLQKV